MNAWYENAGDEEKAKYLNSEHAVEVVRILRLELEGASLELSLTLTNILVQ